MHRILGRFGGWRRKSLFAAAVAVLVVGVFAAPAFAVHDTGLFELDGNATNDPAVAGDDWDNVCHQVTGHGLFDTQATRTARPAVDWIAEPNLNASIFTGGGSKDPQDVNKWAWKDGAGGLPDKDNLLHSFAARYNDARSGRVPVLRLGPL